MFSDPIEQSSYQKNLTVQQDNTMNRNSKY